MSRKMGKKISDHQMVNSFFRKLNSLLKILTFVFIFEIQGSNESINVSHLRHEYTECMHIIPQFSSVQSLSHVRLLRPHESQHARPPCPLPTPGVYSNSCPSSRWCHSAISSSVNRFSSCPQSLPASGSFPMSQLFTWGGQSTRVSVSASVLPMNLETSIYTYISICVNKNKHVL